MLLHQKTNSIILHHDDPFSIRELIPQSRTIDHPDYNVAIKHTDDAVRLLRNIGINVPIPAVAHYHWPGKYKPFDHQRTMVEFYLQNRHRCFNLSEMGTGKTAATLWAADILMRQKIVHRAAILAPLSGLERTWMQDIFDVLMHRKAGIVHGGREKRTKMLATDLDFFIINHEGVMIEEIFKAISKRQDINLIVVDEGSFFRNHDTNKFKYLKAMLRPDQMVWWITGTPCPNAPTDAWAQAKIMCPHRVDQFFGAFKRRCMVQMSQFKWAPKAGSEQTAFNALQPAIRFLKKDCLNLPPVTHLDMTATLTKVQRDHVRRMKDDMIMSHAGGSISAVNAADKINKMRQILCGSIKDMATDTYVTIDHKPRLELLLQAMEQAAAKVIIVVPFKGIIQDLAKEIQKHYSVAVLNGDVSIGARNRIIQNFKNTAHPHALLCHPQVMSHGLNFTEADMMIFYAPIYSNDQFRQVIERINRAGQIHPMTIVRIGAHPLEWAIYKQVDNRDITQQSVLKLYETAMSAA